MTLPAISFDEAAAIDTVDKWIGEIHEKMTARFSREWLEAALRDHLQQGLIEALQVIEWADRGDPIADAALRRVDAEMRERNDETSPTIKAYGIKAAIRGPVTRGRGHYWFDDWRRNIGIAVLVHLTKEQFGLHATRNREQKRRRQASASSVVAAALGRHRVNIGESAVANISVRLQGQVLAYVAGPGNVPK
jgi:hypothetical protein